MDTHPKEQLCDGREQHERPYQINHSLGASFIYVMTRYDAIIVGGGIVGLATALQLQRKKPTARLLLLEKDLTPC